MPIPKCSKVAPLLAALAALLLLPLPAPAHVKLFVRETPHTPVTVRMFSFSEPAVQAWIAIILAALAVAWLLERLLPDPPERFTTIARELRPQILHLFQILVGLSLLLTAVKGAILAPHLEDSGRIGHMLRFVEGGIGVLFIANRAVRLGAALMILLFLGHTALFGFTSSMEYFNYLGIALFLYLERVAESESDGRSRALALPILRIHTGIALGVLAWTEKLISPELAVRFLEKNQVNFMNAVSPGFFSDRMFVLCAGCTELLFAVIFALGLITRINTLSIASFLIASNLYFFAAGKTQEALTELTGHLPLLATAIILAIYGARPDRNRPSIENLPAPVKISARNGIR